MKYVDFLSSSPPKWLKLLTFADRGCLVPLFDMINHGTNDQYNLKYQFSTARGMVVTVAHDISEGEELLVSYSDRPNDELLIVSTNFFPAKF